MGPASMRARVYKPTTYFQNWRSQIEASIPIFTRRISFEFPLDQRIQTTMFLIFSGALAVALASPTGLANQDIEGARNQAGLHKYQPLPLVSDPSFCNCLHPTIFWLSEATFVCQCSTIGSILSLRFRGSAFTYDSLDGRIRNI
jgi:hypothetical protein